MVRGELASRRPTPSAYNANQGNANQGNANQGNANQGIANQGNANQGNANQGNANQMPMGLEAEDASFASVVALSIALAAGSVPSPRLSAHSVVAIIWVLFALRLLAATAAANLPVGLSRC